MKMCKAWFLLTPRAALVAALIFLAGCAERRYTVCFVADDEQYCRGGYKGEHDAKVAADTLASLPGIDGAYAEPTNKHDKQKQALPLQEPRPQETKPEGQID